MLRGGLLAIHPLPNVAGSAADRAAFFLLNGVIGDGPRASPSQLHAGAEPGGGMTVDLYLKKRSAIKKAHLGCVEADFRSFTPFRMWLATPRIDQLLFAQDLNGVVACASISTSRRRRAGRRDGLRLNKKKRLPIKKTHLRCAEADFRSFTSCQMWLAAPRIGQRLFAQDPNGVVGDGACVHFTQSRDDRRF